MDSTDPEIEHVRKNGRLVCAFEHDGEYHEGYLYKGSVWTVTFYNDEPAANSPAVSEEVPHG